MIWVAILAGCARSASLAPATAPAAAPATASPAIDAASLRADLYAIADDSFNGRETGTPDATRAAAFLGRRLMELGVEPAGDSLYYQRVPLLRLRYSRATRFEVSGPDIQRDLRLGDDLAPLLSLGPGLPEPKREVEGELVFAGYGSPEQLRGLPVRGRVVTVIHGAPPGLDTATTRALESSAELSNRIGRILLQQPLAIIVLMNGGTTPLWHQLQPDLLRPIAPADVRLADNDDERPLPMILFGPAKAGSPLLPHAWPAEEKPQILGGHRFAAHVDAVAEPFAAYNVIATVRGTGGALARTYVAYGAHYDHIGVLTPVNGDSIANGADDDGSGSVALLAIAHEMAAAPPLRSVLFVWHTAEEKGLLGSAYFTSHPTVPIDSIVAQINVDMIGRNAPSSLYLIGPRAAPNEQSKVLGALADSVNRAEAAPFVFNMEWDAADHPEQFYQRSDQFNYARHGIPVVFFTTGLHADYHAVTDEPSKIDFDKLTRVTRLLSDLGRAVADRPTRPR